MKIKHLLGMAAVALMAAACSNDVNDVLAPEAAPQKGIPFVATIAPKSFDATTRALTENGDGSLSAKWKVDEEIALQYSQTNIVNAKVTAVNDDGSATIEFMFTDENKPSDGTKVYFYYPAGSEKTAFLNSKLYKQDGTLCADRDLRSGANTFKVNDDGITLKDKVDLFPAMSIVKFSLQDITGNTVSVNKMIISTSKYKYTITPTDASGTNSLYVTLHSLADATFWFEATGTDGKPYIAKGTSKLKLGEFYQTTLKMATVGDVILSNGKFAAPKTEGAEAMIAYLGNEAEDAPHGLAIALELANSNYVTWDNSGNNNGDKTAAELVEAWGGTPAVGTWRLPSAYDWQHMLIGCGSNSTYVSELPSDNDVLTINYGNFPTLWKTATGANFMAVYFWTNTEIDDDNAWYIYPLMSTGTFKFVKGNKASNCKVLACLTF